ncbi:MAG: sulfatase/phosphatase domain-containing protein, partial [Planctomycetota bacterium]
DFLPTACEIAGVDVPADVDGISYLPTLRGSDRDQKRHEYLYWASQEGETAVGIRHQNWKLVRYRRDLENGADWRLYDLSSDIGETRDVSRQHPNVVTKILGLIRRDELPDMPPPR